MDSLKTEVTEQTLLGFFPRLSSKKFEKETRETRRKILCETLSYMQNTERFSIQSEQE